MKQALKLLLRRLFKGSSEVDFKTGLYSGVPVTVQVPVRILRFGIREPRCLGFSPYVLGFKVFSRSSLKPRLPQTVILCKVLPMVDGGNLAKPCVLGMTEGGSQLVQGFLQTPA